MIAFRGQGRGEHLKRFEQFRLRFVIVAGAFKECGERANIVGAEHDIYPGGFFDNSVLVFLSQAPAHSNLHAFVASLHRGQLPQMPVETVRCVLAHRASVKHHEVRLFPLSGTHIPARLQKARHPLGIVHIHLTAKCAHFVGA